MIETILCIFLLLNTATLAIVVFLFLRWIRKTNEYVNDVSDYCDSVVSRTRCIYVNQLEIIRMKLTEEERYEEAGKINQIIEREIKDIEEEGSWEDIEL